MDTQEAIDIFQDIGVRLFFHRRHSYSTFVLYKNYHFTFYFKGSRIVLDHTRERCDCLFNCALMAIAFTEFPRINKRSFIIVANRAIHDQDSDLHLATQFTIHKALVGKENIL